MWNNFSARKNTHHIQSRVIKVYSTSLFPSWRLEGNLRGHFICYCLCFYCNVPFYFKILSLTPSTHPPHHPPSSVMFLTSAHLIFPLLPPYIYLLRNDWLLLSLCFLFSAPVLCFLFFMSSFAPDFVVFFLCLCILLLCFIPSVPLYLFFFFFYFVN